MSVSRSVVNPPGPRLLELRLDDAQRAFRNDVRSFLAAEMRNAVAHADPRDLTGCTLDFELAHQRRAGERGLLAVSAPESHGGGVGVVIDGCPPRIAVSQAQIQHELDRVKHLL